MQRSACRPTGSASARCGRCRPARCAPPSGRRPSVTPVHIEVYGFIRSPVEERGSSWRNTSRSDQAGRIFSTPTTLISVSGRVRHIRPLPSDSTTTSVPVSATAKFAPEMPTWADMNFLRRCWRAAPASSRGRSVSSRGASGISRRKISLISARLRWMAGTRMWLGRSSLSWTISSARSVSSAAIPASARASFMPISWVAMDFTLTTSSAPARFTRSATMALASAPSRAQCTCAPAAVAAASNCSR